MPGADSSQEMPTCFCTTTAPIRLCYDQTLTGNVSFLLLHVSFKTLSLCEPRQKEGPQSPHRGNPAAPPQGSRSGHPRANASPPLPYTKLGAFAGILSKLLTTSESTEAQKGLGATVFLRPPGQGSRPLSPCPSSESPKPHNLRTTALRGCRDGIQRMQPRSLTEEESARSSCWDPPGVACAGGWRGSLATGRGPGRVRLPAAPREPATWVPPAALPFPAVAGHRLCRPWGLGQVTCHIPPPASSAPPRPSPLRPSRGRSLDLRPQTFSHSGPPLPCTEHAQPRRAFQPEYPETGAREHPSSHFSEQQLLCGH